MFNIGEALGSGAAQVLTGFARAFETGRAAESRPEAPDVMWRTGMGTWPGFHTPEEAPEGIEMPAGMAAELRMPEGATMPPPWAIGLPTLEQASIEDLMRELEARRTVAGRQLETTEAYGGALERAEMGFGATVADWRQALGAGEATFREAGAGLRRTVTDAERDAAQAIERIDEYLGNFRSLISGIQSNIATLSSSVMEEAKSGTAALMSVVAPAIALRSRQQITEMVAGMRAQGVPEAQIQGQAAAVAADANRQIGDLLTQIGVSENSRLSTLAKDLAGFQVQAGLVEAQAAAGLFEEAIEETAAITRNLSQVRSVTSQAMATLANDAASWRLSMTNARSDITALMAQTSLGGRLDMFNMVSAIQEPFLQLAPILEGMFEVGLGLTDMQYNYDMTSFGVDMAIHNQWWDAIQSGLDRNTQLQETEANRHAAESESKREFWGGITEAVLQGGGSAAGGVLSK